MVQSLMRITIYFELMFRIHERRFRVLSVTSFGSNKMISVSGSNHPNDLRILLKDDPTVQRIFVLEFLPVLSKFPPSGLYFFF